MDILRKQIREIIKENFESNISKEVDDLMNFLEQKYDVKLFIYYNKFANTIILSQIVVDKKDRNKGIGTKVMNEICDFADKNNLRIALTPSGDFGGSKTRLISFYKSFGFKNYKGYEFRESMVREPEK
jgi:GNAT superfamily N-acetyltransferase